MFPCLVQFFPTAEECMDFYNQKRCVDGKGLVLPSQIVSLVLQFITLLSLHLTSESV